jgi:hypothetical protein
MAPLRLAAVVALGTSMTAIGAQVRRILDDEPWSDGLHRSAVIAAGVAAVCVLLWTGVVAANARRVVGPAAMRSLPDPRVAVSRWLPSMALVSLAIGVVTVAREREVTGGDASRLALLLALVALLAAIPLTVLPLGYLAGVARQVGGQGLRVARWMWAPALLSLAAIAPVVVVGVGGGDDGGVGGTGDGPLRVMGVAAAVPSVVLIVVAWRAAATVEEAVVVAHRRVTRSPRATGRMTRAREHPVADVVHRDRVDIAPGAGRLRLAIVTSLAGMALLLLVGAGVLLLFSSLDGDGLLLPSERRQAADVLAVLRRLGLVVCVALVAVVSAWSFVAVLNVRRASSRRRNPLLAAAMWSVSGVLVWMLADLLVVGEPGPTQAAGFASQAAILALPFVCLDRAAATVGARRIALRATYAAVVALVVAGQLVGVMTTPDRGLRAGEDLVALAGFLGLGAVVLLASTLAVTLACRAIEDGTARMVAAHNVLVDQRGVIEQRATGHARASTMATVMPGSNARDDHGPAGGP